MRDAMSVRTPPAVVAPDVRAVVGQEQVVRRAVRLAKGERPARGVPGARVDLGQQVRGALRALGDFQPPVGGAAGRARRPVEAPAGVAAGRRQEFAVGRQRSGSGKGPGVRPRPGVGVTRSPPPAG